MRKRANSKTSIVLTGNSAQHPELESQWDVWIQDRRKHALDIPTSCIVYKALQIGANFEDCC